MDLKIPRRTHMHRSMAKKNQGKRFNLFDTSSARTINIFE